MLNIRKYSWRPDVADHRDYAFALTLEVLPPVVNRIGLSNPIEDQGQLGSCTGNASTSAVEIICNLTTPLSRLMAYYNGRAIEGTIRQDAGCEIRDVIKGISVVGVCKESLYPYIINNFTRKPTVYAYKNAKTLIPRIKKYERLTSLQDVKTALAHGLPVVFGFAVPGFFEGQDVATTGWVRMPLSTDRIIGGHAVVAVGYDDTAVTPFIWVRNSWGTGWGINGYFKMDQQWFTDPARLVDDMWVMTPV